MPIGLTYRNMQIQPGVVHFHGRVLIAPANGGEGEVNPATSITPGMTWVQLLTGVYQGNYNDGVTVGLASIICQPLTLIAGTSSYTIQTSRSTEDAGQSAIVVLCRDGAGAAVNPPADEGFSYVLVRSNSSVVMK